MVIDLSKCRNARKCVEACQGAHHLRPYEYHLNTLIMQESANTSPYYMPKPCQHCDNPPCVAVCPVDATFKRQDGIVLIDNERCIGCRFCMAACPYSARMFHWEEPLMAENDNGKEYNIELNVPQKKGTISNACLVLTDWVKVNCHTVYLLVPMEYIILETKIRMPLPMVRQKRPIDSVNCSALTVVTI